MKKTESPPIYIGMRGQIIILYNGLAATKYLIE